MKQQLFCLQTRGEFETLIMKDKDLRQRVKKTVTSGTSAEVIAASSSSSTEEINAVVRFQPGPVSIYGLKFSRSDLLPKNLNLLGVLSTPNKTGKIK